MAKQPTRQLMAALFCLFFIASGNASETTSYTQIYFQTDSFNLNAAAQQQLSELMQQIPTDGELEIFIAGHTDAEGNSNYNLKLSQARANSVAKELTLLGLPETIVHSNYFGESRPVSSNQTEEGKSKNRRVEIMIKNTVLTSINDIANVDADFKPETFTLNTATTQSITGHKGIEITVPADAFVTESGKEVNGADVNMTLTEFTGMADAFFHGVTTMSDKGILESGGMFKLTATANGEVLQLKPGKELDVKIPALKAENDMKVYLSKSDSSGQLVWVQTDQTFKAVSKPTDQRAIQLDYGKYEALLKNAASMPEIDDLMRKIYSFSAKRPTKPETPRLYLLKEKDLRTSGLRAITHNKKIQEKMLARINANLEKENARRTKVYEKRMPVYLRDSADYQAKLSTYNKARVDYIDYSNAMKAQLDSLKESYNETVFHNRVRSFVKKAMSLSDSGKLYNSDLVKHCRSFCSSAKYLERDYGFEDKLNRAYNKLSLNGNVKSRYEASYYYFDPSDYRIYDKVMKQEDVKQAMLALIDDNPYMEAGEKKLQKVMLDKPVPAYYYTPPATNTYYAATVGQLGYVNCDRLHQQDAVVAMDVKNLNKDAESVAFIKGINASQHISGGDNKFKRDEDVVLMSVYFENGRPKVAYRELKMNGNQKVELEYKEMKTDEFKQLVLSLI